MQDRIVDGGSVCPCYMQDRIDRTLYILGLTYAHDRAAFVGLHRCRVLALQGIGELVSIVQGVLTCLVGIIDH